MNFYKFSDKINGMNTILRAREQLWENLHSAAIFVDAHDRIRDTNPAARTLLQEICGEAAWTPGTVVDDLFASQPDWLRIFQTREAGAFVARLGEGEALRSFAVAVYPVTSNKGKYLGRTFFLREDTQRARLFQALQVSEERYRLLAQNSSDVIWTMSLDGRFTYVSPSVLRLRGYTPEEVLEQSMEQAICPGSLPVVLAHIQAALQGLAEGRKDAPVYVEVEQPCKDGSTVWTEVAATTLYDDAGLPAGFLGVSRDITKRRQIEARLRQSEALYRSIIDTSPDGILITDRKGRLTLVSPAMSRLLGAENPQALEGLEFNRFISAEKRFEASQDFLEAIAADAVGTVEYPLVRLDGSSFIAEIAMGLIRSQDGAATGAVCVVRDASERKAAEKKIQETLYELKVFNNLMVGRELRMVELKKEINDLLAALDRPPKYVIPPSS